MNSPLLQWIYSKCINHQQGKVLILDICNDPCSAIFNQTSSIIKIDSISEIGNKAEIEWANYFNTIYYLAQAVMTRTESKNLDKILHFEGFLITRWRVRNALFGEYDGGFKYWHKSNKAEIKKALPDNYTIEKMRYFNIVDTIFEAETPSLYQESVPHFRSENLPDSYKGLSVLVFAKKH